MNSKPHVVNTELNVKAHKRLIQIHLNTTQKLHMSIFARKISLGTQSALANSKLQSQMQIQNKMPNIVASLVYLIRGSAPQIDLATVARVTALLAGS
jgi:hypothetical protein